MKSVGIKTVRNIFLCTAVLIVSSVTATEISAALIESDLFSQGDNLITLDTDTGFEWLDWTATVNRSYSAILDGAGGFDFIGAGFRHAEYTEVEHLLSIAGIANNFGDSPGHSEPVLRFMNLVGVTDSGSNSDEATTMAMVNTPAGSGVAYYVCLPAGGENGVIYSLNTQGQQMDQAALDIGHALVRETTHAPAPTSLILLGSGFAGFLALRRKIRE